MGEKRIFGALLKVIGVVMVSGITSFITYYYLDQQKDEEEVREIVEDALNGRFNPVFASPRDATAYYERFVDEQITDSFITDMTEEIFVRIAKELIGRNGTCNKTDILKEYLKTYSPKYEYIPDDDSAR